MPARPPVRAVRCALLSAASGLLFAVAGQAQLEVAPYVGLYRPTTILGSGDGVPADAGDTVKHQRSVTVGLRVTKWWPGRLGFEGRIGYAPSSLSSNIMSNSGALPTAGTSVYSAHVWTISAEALVRLTPPTRRARLYVGGGVGVVGHGGLAYENSMSYSGQNYTGPTTFVGAIGSVGAAITLSRWVSLRLDAEDFLYFAHLGPCGPPNSGYGGVCDVFGDNDGRTTGSRLQDDLVLSLGLALGWSKLPRAGGL